MNLFEINKIIGAVLFSVLIILGVSIVTANIFDRPPPAQPGYVIAGTEEAMEEETEVVETEPAEAEAAQPSTETTEESETAAAEPAGESGSEAGEATGAQEASGDGEQMAATEPAAEAGGNSELLQRIAAGDPEKGKKVARKCAACHTFDEGGGNRVGPNLYGVVGREVAAVPDFSYSSALKELGGTWDYERLELWLEKPKDLVAKTSMAFAGIRKEDDRADLIAYMRSLSPDAPPLP